MRPVFVLPLECLYLPADRCLAIDPPTDPWSEPTVVVIMSDKEEDDDDA